MFIGINHITVVVKNKEEASEFYFNKLGFEKVMVGKSLWAKVGSQYIRINEKIDKKPLITFSHFAVELDNLKSYLEDLIKKGIEVFDLDEDLEKIDININLEKPTRSFFAYDPSGNMIEFIDESNIFFNPE